MIRRTSIIVIAGLIGLLLLSACGGSDETATEVKSGDDSQASPIIVSQAANENNSQASDPEKARLSDDYTNALSVQGQLALGIIQMEESDQAFDEGAAAEMLPLWQALQSLSNSETTAEVEIEAVVNQIQDSMTAEQIRAIADMKLTEDSLTSLIEEGNFAFGRGGPGGGRAEGGEGGFPGGGLPGGGGRGQGGGLPGGGPGEGRLGGGDLSEDDIATRRAEFAQGDFSDIQDRLLIGAVVRTLQQKSGEAPERSGIFDTVFAIISEETGLSAEEIRDQTADGMTLAELVEANGGDLEAVRASLIEAFNELPNAADVDAEQMAAEWLGLSERPD